MTSPRCPRSLTRRHFDLVSNIGFISGLVRLSALKSANDSLNARITATSDRPRQGDSDCSGNSACLFPTAADLPAAFVQASDRVVSEPALAGPL